jgi:hypothetical protein
MSTTVTKWIEVDIDVEMDDFEDDELIDELKLRGYSVQHNEDGPPLDMQYIRELADKVYWHARDHGQLNHELRNLVSELTGKIL